jgi:UDP:flavonoid glycosyltransferase YjiC (YdhE family)
MRVLFTSVPAVGHFFPIVSLALAFRAVGHDVMVALAEHSDKAAAAGLPVVDVAPGYDAVSVVRQVFVDDPEFAEAWNEDVEADIEPRAPMFAGINRPLVPGTMDLADRWRPDLVVYEQTTTVGPMVAARLGIPAVQRNIGPYTTNRAHHVAAALMGDLRERYGIGEVPGPVMTVETMPPSMLYTEPEGWFMGGASYNGGGVLGDRLPERPGRPRIAISMGGGFAIRYFGLGALEPVISAAAQVDAEFVLALGGADADTLGALPPNIRPIGWIPYGELFRTCSGVIHHGGSSTMLTALEANIPQLVVPDPADKAAPAVGRAVHRRGVGLMSSCDQVDAAMLERLLGDEKMATATAEVHEEIGSLPPPATIAARLADLVS